MTDEVETMAYSNEVPWHGLGVNVKPDVTPEEMLIAAGLNWQILPEPIYSKIDGREVRIPGRRAMIRSHDQKVMTIASQNWRPLQNSDLLGFFKDYAEAGGATLETAGSLRGGSIVWALANINDSFKVGGNDKVKGYLLFTSPHKVGEAIKVRTTTVRVVCANTMTIAENSSKTVNHYKQNHLSEFNIEKAKEAVEKAHETLAEAGRRAQTLHKLKLSVSDTTALLNKFFGTKRENDTYLDISENKKIMKISNSINNAPGAEPETAWGFLNGVTHWADHVNGRNADSRLFRSWVGDMGRVKNQVEEELFNMA